MANITGWGRGTWGEGAWGEPVPVTLTGLAATSALGTVSVVAKANVTPSSQVGTSAVGTLTFDCEANVSPSGVSATSALGTLIVVAKANVTPSSQVGTSAVGSLTVVAKANVTPSSQVGTSAVGGVGVNGDAVANGEADLTATATAMMIVSHKDMSDDTAYTLTKAYFDALPEMKASNALLATQDGDRALHGLTAKLHPGAIRYYEEMGIEVPENLR